jgi:hypothetical protein
MWSRIGRAGIRKRWVPMLRAAKTSARPFWACACHSSRQRGQTCQSVALSVDQVDRPDPAIYSQAELFAAGQLPTWDSPDLGTNKSATALAPEAGCLVRNLSASVSAVNALVRLTTGPFGIGMAPLTEALARVTIPAGTEIGLRIPFSQSVLNGEQRISVAVHIDHPADANVANNTGEQVAEVMITSIVGRSILWAVPVRNGDDSPRQIDLTTHSPELLATVTPSSHLFAPGEIIIAEVAVDVPPTVIGVPGSIGFRPATVMATAAGALIGGATLAVTVDS